MNSHVRKALVPLVLSLALSGCASLHKRPVAAAPPAPDVPELSQSPLYSPEMSENAPRVPDLPATSEAAVVKPAPPPQKPHHTKKPKTSKPVENTTTAAGATVAPSTAASVADNTPTPPATVERKPPVTQASVAVPGAPAAASPIGDLTTGSAADAAQTSHQAEDLIRTTREGVQGIKRPLSSDEKKTVAEIWAFLDRAQQALKNGDTDGANGLATKAKLLLDELTQN